MPSYTRDIHGWDLKRSAITYQLPIDLSMSHYESDYKFINEEHKYYIDQLITCFIHWVLISYYYVLHE